MIILFAHIAINLLVELLNDKLTSSSDSNNVVEVVASWSVRFSNSFLSTPSLLLLTSMVNKCNTLVVVITG